MGLKQTTGVILLPNPPAGPVIDPETGERVPARNLRPVRFDIVTGLTIQLDGEVFEHPVEGSDRVLTDDVALRRPVITVDGRFSNALIPQSTGDDIVDAQLRITEQLADQGNGERAIGLVRLLQDIREAKAACTVLTSMNSFPLRNYLLATMTANRTPESGETINVSVVLSPRDVVRTQTTAAVADADVELLGSQVVEIGF